MEKFETEEFILAVQAHEPIWLTTHPKHKHKKSVNKMWHEIAEQFPEMSKLALKKKWKNLRDSFKRELKKNPATRSRWSYFELMKFISPFEIPTANVTNSAEEIPLLEIPSQAHIRYTAAVNSIVATGDSSSVVGDATTMQINNGNIKSRKRKPRQDTISVVYETSEPKVAKTEDLEMLIEKQQLQPIQHHQLEDTNNTISGGNMVEFMVEKNDDYHFFMSLLPQMSKFETLQKLRIRQHIQQIIIDEACLIQNGYGST